MSSDEEHWLRESSLPKDNINNFLMLLLNNENYTNQSSKLIRKINDKCNNVCYVCLSKPYAEVMNDLKREKINPDRFMFVDIFSSHGYSLEEIENCVFVQNPENLEEVGNAVKKVISEKNCSAIVFDSISTLLIYQKVDSIIKFTYELLSDKKHKEAHKIYLMQKTKDVFKDESTKLINDLYLFADKVIDVKD